MCVIGILDYGAGNLKNVCRALEYLKYKYILIAELRHFSQVDKLVIPGVGAFGLAMQQLKDLNLIASVLEFAASGKQIFGICLGMQMLFQESSELGISQGLGLLPGTIQRIPAHGQNGQAHKIPHIGWNTLIPNEQAAKKALQDIHEPFYFVHSFMARPAREEDIIAYSDYNGIAVPALVGRDNIIGCQFHPEKSRETGLKMIQNILEME